MPPNNNRSPGFTVLELSIVLIIIGLIAGGIVVGQALIYAATLRHAGSDIEKLRTAINTFYTKYNCYPGDCQYATQLFTLASQESYGGNTNKQNGDGDGLYDVWYEGMTRLWEELGDANLWPGTYTGHVGTGWQPGVNIPSLSWADHLYNNGINQAYGVKYLAMYVFYNYLCPSGHSESCQNYSLTFSGTNRILIQGVYNGWPSPIMGFNCQAAWDLDTKFDDGLPFSGTIQAMTFDTNVYTCNNYDARSGVAPPATQKYTINIFKINYGSSPLSFSM